MKELGDEEGRESSRKFGTEKANRHDIFQLPTAPFTLRHTFHFGLLVTSTLSWHGVLVEFEDAAGASMIDMTDPRIRRAVDGQ